MSDVEVKIENLDEVLRRISPEIYAEPLRTFWERAAIAVENLARTKAPVDTGRLRASMAHELDSASPPIWAKVGSNVAYAPYMEYGTGTQSDGPGGRGGVHWPPPGALDVWAQRHGFPSGAVVAKIIGQRGGLEPRRYLRGALQEAMGQISGFIAQLAADIGAKWGG